MEDSSRLETTPSSKSPWAVTLNACKRPPTDRIEFPFSPRSKSATANRCRTGIVR